MAVVVRQAWDPDIAMTTMTKVTAIKTMMTMKMMTTMKLMMNMLSSHPSETSRFCSAGKAVTALALTTHSRPPCLHLVTVMVTTLATCPCGGHV